jgi:hypothetical protein
MRTLVPSILACLSLAAFTSGCGNPERAPLDVSWTFGTLDCDQVGVETIHVEIDREILNPSDFSCFDRSGGITTGAHLGNFLLGQYTVTVIGFDATGAEVIEGTKVVTVGRGQNVAEVDAGGAVTLEWTFDGLSCAQASVTTVNLSVDGTLITDVNGSPDIPCTQAGQDAAQIAPLLAGTHSFELVGLFGDGTVAYVASGVSVAVSDGQDAAFLVDLAPAAPTAAEADLAFSFGNGLSCTQAGLDTVRIFIDPNPDGSRNPSFTQVIDLACTPGLTGAVVSPLEAGFHSFGILGIRGTQLLYATTNPPLALFEPGLQTPLAVNAPPVGAGTGLTAVSRRDPASGKVAAKAFAARAPDAN